MEFFIVSVNELILMINKLIKRDAYVNQLKDYINSDFVKVYIGIRRSGKTSLMYNIIDELKSMGIEDENIIFVSFESREYAYIDNSKQLDEIVYNKTENLEGKIYLFFDEIQQVKGWEKSINSYRVSLTVTYILLVQIQNYCLVIWQHF